MGRKRAVPSPYQLSLWEEWELERCASHIREDLGVAEIPDYEAAMHLTELHGGPPETASHGTGDAIGHLVRVNPSLPVSALPGVILHELVHRLADSPRWEYLNPVRTSLPRRVWLELLACRVVQ